MSQDLIFQQLCEHGRALLNAGQHEESLALLTDALALNDSDPDLHEDVGAVNFMLGNYAAAVTHFTMLTRLDPRRASAFINLGAVYNRQEQYQKAIEILRKAIQVDKKSSEAYYNLGIAHRNLKQWAMALPAYREAIRLNPSMAEAYQNIGNVYMEMGSVQQAVQQFRRALELRPDFEKARRGLEKAQHAVDEAKAAASPFGRLVDESHLQANQNRAPTVHDESGAFALNRQEIADLGERASQVTADMLQILRNKLDPAIRTLNRALTQGASRTTALQAYDSFLQARTQYTAAMQKVEKALEQLRLRQQSGNTP